MTTIYLDNAIQLGIFLTLYERPKGLSRSQLTKKLDKPRTTIYDNIVKMFNKKVDNIPYIKIYNKPTMLRGRPIVYYYIPKGIRIHSIDFKVLNNEKEVL